MDGSVPQHSDRFRRRRLLNWIPIGIAFALLYMGRYNLMVVDSGVGDWMNQDEVGLLFGWGALVYVLSLAANSLLVGRLGGRRALLIGIGGAGLCNLAIGVRLIQTDGGLTGCSDPLSAFAGLYYLNMYFQSFALISVVTLAAPWFHVRESGRFGAIFGTFLGLVFFLAFSVNTLLLEHSSAAFR